MIVNKLFLDNAHTRNPNGSLTTARNIRYDDNFLNYTNEDGFTKLHTFDHDICGIIPYNTGLVIFTTNNAGIDRIYQYENGTFTLSLQGNLSLSTNNPITGVYQNNNIGDLIVGFNDTDNPIRVFNFNNLYVDLDDNKEFIDSTIGLNKLKLFPYYTMPELDISEAKEGSLPKGTYQFVLSYYIGDHDRLNWSYPSRAVYVAKMRPLNMIYNAAEETKNVVTTNFSFIDAYQYDSEKNTDKSIKLIIESLDTTYSKYKLAIIQRTDTSSKVYDLGDYDTSVNSHHISKLTDKELSLDEVTIPYIAYDSSKDITISDSRLTLLGTGSSGLVNYQKYANNISVKYAITDLANTYLNDYPDRSIDPIEFPGGLTAEFFYYATNKTAIYDEVYSLYLGLIGKDGTNKGFYHIPGRAPLAVSGGLENRELTIDERNSYNDDGDSRRNNDIGAAPIVEYYYQLYNTAANYDEDDRYLSYWENRTESYPNTSDFEIWDVDGSGTPSKIGDLGGEKVRHHKMPDISKLYNESNIDGSPTKAIKVYLTDVKFPAGMADEIQGFVLAYANRNSSNSTVLGYHPLIPNDFFSEYGGDAYGPRRSVPTTVIGAGGTDYITSDTSGVRFNDFGLLTNKPAIANPYLKVSYTSNASAISDLLTDTTIIKSFNNTIYGVTDYKYIPRDNSATDPSNRGREESLMLNLNVNIGNIPTGEDGFDVCALKSHLDNVFFPFYEQRLSITEHVTQITSDVYSYSTPGTADFDGYLSFYYSIMFRGDQTIELDPTGDITVLTRTDGDGDDDATTSVNAFKCLSISVVNTDFKSMSIERSKAEYVDDHTQVANVLASLTDLIFGSPVIGSYDYMYEYDSTFIIDPSKPNNISYNRQYSFTNSILPTYSHNHNNVFVDTHPHRIARSAIQSKESLVLNWRYFSALEYYEMPKHRGDGVSITGQANMLLIHMEHSLFIAKFKDKISIAEGEAYIGTSDIFDRKPEELIPTKRGTAGIQSRFGSCSSEFGYTFADTYDDVIYNYSNKGFDAITESSARAIMKKYMVNSSSNPLINDDVIFGIDHANKRIIITNLGSTPFTLSYCYKPGKEGWISYHDYIPALMVSNRLGSYSVNRDNLKELYEFNTGTWGKYYNDTEESYIDVLINENPHTSKTINSVAMVSGVDDDANNIAKLFVYNRNQCSAIYTLAEFTSILDYDKIRFIDGSWQYGFIRDNSSNDIIQNIIDDFGNIDLTSIVTREWYELGNIDGRFFIVRLILDNSVEAVFRDLEYNITVNRR